MRTETTVNMDTLIINNVSLKDYNTMKLEATASQMAFPYNENSLYSIITNNTNKKIIVLGKGSNILFSKTYYSDEYLFINLDLLNNIYEMEGKIYAQAGATLTNLVWYAIEKNIANLEFLEDIPGTIGGAIIMNAGTFKDYIGPLLQSVRYYDYDQGKILDRIPTPDDFGKRTSYWAKKNTIILSCILKGKDGDYSKSIEEVARIKQDRFNKQPRNYPNTGSIFARPKNGPAGIRVWEMIDRVGLRGYKKNGAEFSQKHPGFIVNTGSATFDDIIYLVRLAQNKVYTELGAELELEWKII